jgi:hypothetical protein
MRSTLQQLQQTVAVSRSSTPVTLQRGSAVLTTREIRPSSLYNKLRFGIGVVAVLAIGALAATAFSDVALLNALREHGTTIQATVTEPSNGSGPAMYAFTVAGTVYRGPDPRPYEGARTNSGWIAQAGPVEIVYLPENPAIHRPHEFIERTGEEASSLWKSRVSIVGWLFALALVALAVLRSWQAQIVRNGIIVSGEVISPPSLFKGRRILPVLGYRQANGDVITRYTRLPFQPLDDIRAGDPVYLVMDNEQSYSFVPLVNLRLVEAVVD